MESDPLVHSNTAINKYFTLFLSLCLTRFILSFKENLWQFDSHSKMSRWKIHTVISVCNACSSKDIYNTCDLFFNHLRFNKKTIPCLTPPKMRSNLFLQILVDQQKHVISKDTIRKNNSTTSIELHRVTILNFKE